jgi:hypothetical protein
MATISNTPRPGYVWDSADNVWYPIGVGAHQHTNAADTPAVMPYSTYAAAGKNKIINGDFGIWQRGTSVTLGSGPLGAYGPDRFIFEAYGSSTAATVTRQTFTPGTAPVSGYEGQFFGRLTNFATASAWQIRQRIEDVRTFAGQTVTFSFWVKASTSLSGISYQIIQNFGSGGSSTFTADIATGQTISTSWTRYSVTTTIPSISGKTIGTGSYLEFNFYQGGSATNSSTIDTWGWQVEAGSNVTAFQTATGNPASELAACQRYYWRSTPGTNFGVYGLGQNGNTIYCYVSMFLPVSMRVAPTSLDVPTTITRLKLTNSAVTNFTISAIALDTPTLNNLSVVVTSSGLTGGQSLMLTNNNDAAGFIGASAEL